MPLAPLPLAHELAHGGHAHEGAGLSLPLLAVGLLLACYLAAATRLWHQGGRRWSPWRTGAFTLGCALLALALAPPLAAEAHADFRGHMLQHLLIGMYAPLGLVLGAPVTLALRTLGGDGGRRLVRVLNLPPVRALTHPVTALLFSAGGLYVLYGTPLYHATAANPLLHELVHLHFLVSGCVFAWSVAGPDPAPHRPSAPFRLVVLGLAIAAHATLSQLLYAGLLDVDAPAAQVRGGAELMYYGGDFAEILLALALMATWRPRRAALATP
ncbi:cytochrome c oxidase assembly protein [Actinomadura hibisca]|uniref:cytochrome c oxidase assembly protein n=1 Tax=Actinomadura hibisca TaxID=68565 RepID=UPI0008320505|nr:cytochrome c oxidase assembly protein [Actinomadura hibisca]